MNIITKNTPTEDMGHGLYIKREDLACPAPGPPFAKIRGLYHTLLELEKKRAPAVGYMDTTISMAGWGISYLCHALKLKIRPVIYWPSYKDGILRHNIQRHLEVWQSFGASVHPIQASKLSIMRATAAQHLLKTYGTRAEMLPQGLPSNYTIEAVSEEVGYVPKKCLGGSIVLCVGSGVMVAGVLHGLAVTGATPTIYGVLVAPKNKQRMYQKIQDLAGFVDGSIFNPMPTKLNIIDAGYEYSTPIEDITEFPCNDYYDKKAYIWMKQNFEKLKKPVLFWNIGGNGEN